MSRRTYLVCDSCKREESEDEAKRQDTWERLTVVTRYGKLVERHACGRCNHQPLIERMNRL